MLKYYFKEMLKDKKFIYQVLYIAVPLMLQQLVVSSVNLIDNLMVGQLGDFAISSVSSANRFYFIATMSINGLIGACVIFIAQFNGANNHKKMQETFRFALVSAYILCIIFFISACFFPHKIMSFFIQDNSVIKLGIDYLKIACFSYIPMVLSLVCSASLRALGKTKIPLFISMSSVFINLILDYCLIFGNFNFPILGVRGAAIATVAARATEMLLYLIVLKKIDVPFKTKISDLFIFGKDLAFNIIKKALPLCTNEILWSSGMATLLKLYSTRGLIANTAYNMTTTISDLFFVLFAGMATASTVLIGTALGANELKKAKDYGYKLIAFSVLLSLFFGISMFITSYFIPYFYKASFEASHLASNFLKVQGVLFWLYMFNTQCYFTLRAGGDTKNTMFMDSGFMWLINIPVVSLFAFMSDFNIIILYIIGQSTDLVKAIVSFRLVKKELWLCNLTND